MHGPYESQRSKSETDSGNDHQHPAGAESDGRESGVVFAQHGQVAVDEHHEGGRCIDHRSRSEPPAQIDYSCLLHMIHTPKSVTKLYAVYISTYTYIDSKYQLVSAHHEPCTRSLEK